MSSSSSRASEAALVKIYARLTHVEGKRLEGFRAPLRIASPGADRVVQHLFEGQSGGCDTPRTHV
jgi:hypothetical protein